MTYVIPFTDYTPTPSTSPWTGLTIEEAPTAAGPWTLIDTQTISPVDADPAHPAARSFTTSLATLVAGWYKVTFTQTGAQQPFDPVYNGPSYVATRDDVARKLQARTRTDEGLLVGTFDDTTTITGELVDQMIDDAAAIVATRIGQTIPADKNWLARRAVAIRAAMEVELSFTPEQTAGDETAYGRLLAQYEEAMLALEDAVAGDSATTPEFASVTVTSPTMTAQNALITPAELLP